MAKETVERLVDDIDGSQAQASVRFAIDGHDWSIDLNAKHEQEMRTKLGPFVEAARRVGPHRQGSGRRTTATIATADKGRAAAIRAWALTEGVQLPERGRIAGAVQAAFEAKDVPGLYAATGLELEQVPKRGRRRIAAEFSSAE